MGVKVFIHLIRTGDLCTIYCKNHVARPDACFIERGSLRNGVYSGRHIIQIISKSQHVAGYNIRLICHIFLFAVTRDGQRNGIIFVQIIEREPCRDISRYINMIPHKRSDRIARKNSRFVSRGILCDRHDLRRIITDHSYNDDGADKGKDEVKERSCKYDRRSPPDRNTLKRAFLRDSFRFGNLIILVIIVLFHHALHLA